MANYNQSCTVRNKEFNRILEYGLANEVKNMPESNISTLDMLLLPVCMFDYTPRDIIKENVAEIKLLESGDAQIIYTDSTMEIVDNALVIEDLKMFL